MRGALDNRQLMDLFMAQAVPLIGVFELTSRCNLRCAMCYVGDGEGDLDASEWIRLLTQARDAGMLFAVLTGGEPLLHPDFDRILRHAAQLGVRLVLNTNGTTLTSDVVTLLQANPPAEVQVSLYAASDAVSERTTGSASAWRRALEGVDRLIAAGLRVSMRTTLVAANVEDLEGMWSEVAQRGLVLAWTDYVSPMRANSTTCMELEGVEGRLSPTQYRSVMERLAAWHERDFPDSVANMRKDVGMHLDYLLHARSQEAEAESGSHAFTCHAGHVAFAVRHDGVLLPCILCREPVVDLTGIDVAEGWRLLRQACRDMPVNEDCEGCELASRCHHCPARTQLENGRNAGCPAYMRAIAGARVGSGDIRQDMGEAQ